MEVIKTEILDLFIVKPSIYSDERGYFEKLYSKKVFQDNGLDANFVDLNHSMSLKMGTFRGFHFQRKPEEETKLIRCLRGAIKDYVIDMREKSETYRRVYSIDLSEENQLMLFIPAGLAHGFQALKNDTEVVYLSSNYYSKEHEVVINPEDPMFNIQYDLELILSEKDRSAPFVNL